MQREVNLRQEYERKDEEMKANLHEKYEKQEEEMNKEMNASILKFELKSSEVNKRLALEVSELQNEMSTKTKVLEEIKKEADEYANDCSELRTSRQKAVEDLKAQIKVNKALECDKNAIEKEKKFLENDTVRLNDELIRLQHELEQGRITTENYKILISESECSLKIEKEKSTSLDRELNKIQRATEIQQWKNNQVDNKIFSSSLLFWFCLTLK